MLPQCAATFNFNISSSTTPVNFLGSDGVVKAREVGVTSETTTLTVGIQDIDFVSLMTAFGEFALFQDGIDEAQSIELCPLTITSYSNGAISSETNTWAFNRTDNVIMTKVTTIPANVNEYRVLAVGNAIQFHPDLVGKAVNVCVTQPNRERGVIGDQNVFLLADDFSFQGLFTATSPSAPYVLSIPHMERTSNPTILHGGSEMQIRFTAIEGNDSNNQRRPFRIYSLDSNYSRVI